ncbi:Myb-like DNA-binding domain protein [Dictyocaulus viviparus]|uniref:Myb-like DNA-binding domain protein n=1 Tax=Dictyocaulus viviparus TaxID=29172 RepID=A0A0D8Y0G8_DICVI|nr:Myb-like DNA-binding domain protein [Dictyocaulus viviparus]
MPPKRISVAFRLRSPRFVEQIGVQLRSLHPYTPPPILSPMRNGSGLFWQIAKNLGHPSQAAPSICSRNATQNGHVPDDHEMDDNSPGLRIVDEAGAGPSDTSCNEATVTSSTESVHPARKNGFICSQSAFADELEALRKISWASTSSSSRSAEEILRKHSMDPDEYLRKASCISDCYYDLPMDTWPKMSDAIPHINIGREYQARVRKWNDRKIHDSELEAIADRDEIVFSPEILCDIEKDQIEAFELLACSQAIPRPGRNKELALHLLMENKGNIEAAVADLLRSDTLDWEQYQIIYGSHYLDSSGWTPEEVNAFQDAIYKTEKDFHQVAQELPSKTVRECVEFYYTWKKACPDDYRKLRNLRRKRQLLELNLQQMDDVIPVKTSLVDESVSSDPESDVAAPSYSGQDMSDLRLQAGNFVPQTAVTLSPLRDIPSLSSSTSISHSLFVHQQSPPLKDLSGLQRNYQPSVPRTQLSSVTGSKKGAQPSADGFFHCRLCDKCFEKVKSLNAHMKSHAMKARAEAEAKAQVDAHLAAAQSNSLPNGPISLSGLTRTLQGVTPSMSNISNHTASGLNLPQGLSHGLLSPQGIGLPHPQAQHPLLTQVHSAIIH